MLRTWISPDSITGLLAPGAARTGVGTAQDAVAVLDWDGVDRLLRLAPADEVMMTARGREVDASRPRSLAALRRWMANGGGVVIHRGEGLDPALATIAASFADDLPGEVTVRVSATPAGTHGAGWRFDLGDVFVAQTAGVEDHYFRPNTVAAAWREGPLDFETYHRERSPLATARLLAGDWLYLPSRWWHMAIGIQDALSLAVGVMPPGVSR